MTNPPPLTGQDIGEADGSITAVLEHALAPSGRSRVEYLTLRVADVRGPYRSAADLIDHLAGQRQLGQTRPQLATIVQRLQTDGLLTAAPVELTADGTRLLQDLVAAIAPMTRELFTDLDPADLTVAHNVLTELTRRARSLVGNPD